MQRCCVENPMLNPTRPSNRRRRRILMGLPGLLAAVRLSSAAAQPADAPMPLFDAHLHYSHDAWERLPPKDAVALLRQAGLSLTAANRPGSPIRMRRRRFDGRVVFSMGFSTQQRCIVANRRPPCGWGYLGCRAPTATFVRFSSSALELQRSNPIIAC